MSFSRPVYPFPAIVGQERMKKALLLNVVNPRLGGVLVRGEKGTAKSTAVRGLAALLPEITVVEGCAFGCDPADAARLCPACAERLAHGEGLPLASRRIRVADLPVGATEDRVLGSLDLEQAIKRGEKHFEPGLLAEAHRGFLYVDEVNLLDDHIVDVLLDAAAMGVNTVEREGVSFTHPAEFVLVGTMNPEEGELRPQLLDRFGLCVQVEGILDLEERMEVVRRRTAFDEDPERFAAAYAEAGRELGEALVRAKELLPRVAVSEGLFRRIVELAIEMGVDGHRADLTMLKAAKTLAALEGRTEVKAGDVREAAELALPHRMRRKPFERMGLDPARMEQALAV
ncbi:MAG: ATP-binding protein [Thermodesulfobacteriota bacterium]